MPYVRRKPRASFKKKPSFAKRVRKVISSTAQVKHASNTSATASMDQDVMYFTSPTQNIAQGTSITTRVGDQIKLKYLRLNGLFHASALANACTRFRVAVFFCADGKSASSVTSGAFTAAEIFMPNTTSTNTYGMFDEKYVNVLADIIVDLNSSVSTSLDVKSWAINIPLKNVTCNYKESGSAFSAKKNLYIMITSYSPNAAQATDTGAFTYSYDLAYNDI